MSELIEGRLEVIRRYSQGVEIPDYYTLLSDAALMAVEYEAERALVDDAAGLLDEIADTETRHLYPQIDAWLARYQEARQR